jgi:hypothetical protein
VQALMLYGLLLTRGGGGGKEVGWGWLQGEKWV